MKHRKKGASVQDLMGIRSFTDYGLLTSRGELLFLAVAPTNISVLSKTSIESKIHHLMMVLTTYPELEITCTDASECFDGNKLYLTDRKEREDNKRVRSLLKKDVAFLDQMQSEMATARQFLMIGRCRGDKPEQVFQLMNRLEKSISEQGFEVRRLRKADIKRFLALYFDASFNGEQLPDSDGEQFTAYMEPVTCEPKENAADIPAPDANINAVSGAIELGGGFGDYVRGKEELC